MLKFTILEHRSLVSATSPLNDGRFKLSGEAVQLATGKLLVAGGSKNVERYDPSVGKFLYAAGQIQDARRFTTETRLQDGTVLLSGGHPNNEKGADATWIYHP